MSSRKAFRDRKVERTDFLMLSIKRYTASLMLHSIIPIKPQTSPDPSGEEIDSTSWREELQTICAIFNPQLTRIKKGIQAFKGSYERQLMNMGRLAYRQDESRRP